MVRRSSFTPPHQVQEFLEPLQVLTIRPSSCMPGTSRMPGRATGGKNVDDLTEGIEAKLPLADVGVQDRGSSPSSIFESLRCSISRRCPARASGPDGRARRRPSRVRNVVRQGGEQVAGVQAQAHLLVAAGVDHRAELLEASTPMVPQRRPCPRAARGAFGSAASSSARPRATCRRRGEAQASKPSPDEADVGDDGIGASCSAAATAPTRAAPPTSS